MTVFALNSALEAVSVVFLLAALLYGYRLSRLTRGAQIVALAKPKTFFLCIFLSFAALFSMQFLSLLNDIFFPIPYMAELVRILVILTAFSGVFGLYTAVYYYRTSPRRLSTAVEQPREVR